MIISSLLNTDFYKFSQGQVALHQFPTAQVRYEFKCRNNIAWLPADLERINSELDHFCERCLGYDELNYLSSLGYFRPSYIDFLNCYQPNRAHVRAWLDGTELRISVSGAWFLTIYFEVPVLAIVSEVYSDRVLGHSPEAYDGARERLKNKLEFVKANPFPFADFGTRRRHSGWWQGNVIRACMGAPSFLGTSNVQAAYKNGIKPIGTQAHELFMIQEALCPLRDFQKRTLQCWADEYRGQLGIALTDTVGIDAFLRDFDLYFANLYLGLRQDSGSCYDWADKVIAHYEKLGIDPKTKTLVFSDGLDFWKAYDIYNKYSSKANVIFGVGTDLMNDFPNFTPPQIVMKIVECNGLPVAKVSDSPGKGMCESPEFEAYLKKTFGV